jgi:hypothetical protein
LHRIGDRDRATLDAQNASVRKVVNSLLESLEVNAASLFDNIEVKEEYEATEEEERLLEQQPPEATIQAPDLTHTGGIIHKDGTRTVGGMVITIDNSKIESLPGWAFKKGDKFVGADDARGFIAALFPADGNQPDQYLITFYSPQESQFINKKIFEEEYTKLE